MFFCLFFFFKQKTAYEMRISDWSSDVCSSDLPVIAAVNGAAVAGGFEIALACDIIVAADHAVFGLPEVKRGMFAFAGGVQRLARLVPRSTAMTVILTGDPLPAARLHELGVISALVGLDQQIGRAHV